MIIAFAVAAVGLLFIYLEFYLPGSIMAIGGGGLLLLSYFLFIWEGPGILWGIAYLIALAALVIAICKFAIYHIKSAPAIYLKETQEGYFAQELNKEIIGKRGEAICDLKPSGHILIDGKSVQALSETGFISKGEKVIVTGGKGAHYLIKKEI